MRQTIIFLLILVSIPLFGQSGSDSSNGGTRIAVIDFASKGEIANQPYLADAIVEHLITSLIDSKEFTVVERSRLRDVMRELSLQDSDEFNDNLRLRIGELFGAETIVLGSVTKIGDRYTINVRGVDVETGVAIFAKNLDTYSKETLVDLVPKIVDLITGKSTKEDVNKELKVIRNRNEREQREKKRQESLERKKRNIDVLVNYSRVFQISMYVSTGFALTFGTVALVCWLGYGFPSLFITHEYGTTTEEKNLAEARLQAQMLNVAIGFSVATGVCILGVITFAILSAFKISRRRAYLNNGQPMVKLNEKLSMWIDVAAGPGGVGPEIRFSL